jgi:uncharacterized protein YkwD
MSDVFTTVHEGGNCGTTTSTSRHASQSCGGPIIYVGGEWICGQCGDRIAVGGTCGECGAGVDVKRRAVALDRSPDVSPAAVERAIHDAVNDARRERGHSALSFDHHLAGIAREHSRHMVEGDFFDHSSPEGATAADRYDRADYEWRRCGENIAYRDPNSLRDPSAIADEFVDGWLDSDGHRENLLGDGWSVEGIGVYYGSDGTVYATQNFA